MDTLLDILEKKKEDLSFDIDLKKKSNVPYMDMTVWRPRKSSAFKSPKDYSRKQKHRKGFDEE